MRGLTTQQISRESAGLDSIAMNESRAMSRAFTPWGKSYSREVRGRTRRSGAVFEVKRAKIARDCQRTILARELS
jgi:hypothetical protein